MPAFERHSEGPVCSTKSSEATARRRRAGWLSTWRCVYCTGFHLQIKSSSPPESFDNSADETGPLAVEMCSKRFRPTAMRIATLAYGCILFSPVKEVETGVYWKSIP